MKNSIKKLTTGFVSACLFVIFAQAAGFADDRPFGDDSHFDRMSRDQKIAELKRLKQENPAEFERIVKEHKERIREKFRELKEKDPQKYQELKEKMVRHRWEYLKKLKTEDPQKFQDLMRQKMARLDELKTQDPERYNEILRRHPKLQERLQYQIDHPEAKFGEGKGWGKFRGYHRRHGEGDNF